MTAFWVIVAIGVPWAAGAGLMLRLREREPGGVLLAVGAGWLVGQILLMAMLYVALLGTGASRSLWILAILAVLGAALWRRVIVQRRSGTGTVWVPRAACPPVPALAASCQWHPPIKLDQCRRSSALSSVTSHTQRGAFAWVGRALMIAIGISLAAKLYPLVNAHAFIPVRNDDAISMWLFKAKVITTLDRLPLDPSHDYTLGGSNPRYPVFAPLLAAWIPLVTGTWNEHLATLPWLGFYLNLVLLVVGGLRRWLPWPRAWVAAYLVTSLPLLVVHAYRPGYVDLLLAAFLAATVLYLLRWRSTGTFRDWGFAMLFAIAAACMKREGPAVAAVAVLTMTAASWRNLLRLSRWQRVGLPVTGAVATAIVVAVVEMSDVSENVGQFAYHPDAWAPLARHLFEWSSFHLAGWGVVVGMVVVGFGRGATHRWPSLLLTVGLMGLIACVFLLTPQAVFARNDQTPSRLFLQILPGVILALAVPVSSLVGCSPQRRGGA